MVKFVCARCGYTQDANQYDEILGWCLFGKEELHHDYHRLTDDETLLHLVVITPNWMNVVERFTWAMMHYNGTVCYAGLCGRCVLNVETE